MKSRRQKSVNHPTSECSKLVQIEYKGRHDNVTLYMHWQMCGKAILGDAREKKAKEEGVSLRNYKYCADSEKNDNLVHF